MFAKLFNFFSDLDPKLKTLFKGIGIASAITLSGSLLYYYFNPLAFSTVFEGFLLGFVPTLLVDGGLIAAFFYNDLKKSFLDYWNRTVDKAFDLDVEEPKSELEEKLEAELEIVPTSEVEAEIEPEITPEVEPKNLELEQNKLDEEPQELPNLNLNIEPEHIEFESVPTQEPEIHDDVLKVETEIQDINISEIKIVDNDPLSDQPEELKINEQKEIEHETQQLEFMKVRKNLKKVNLINLSQPAVESELKSILKPTEDIDFSSVESNIKKVQFAEPIANVISIRTVPETEEPVEVEFAAITHQEDKKNELDVEPVKVKIEPVEEQPVVFLPQHAAQRAKTRERRAQINIQRNHNQADVLPEGTTRKRYKVDRFSGSGRR